MDSKAVFVRTSKGEDESSGKTANLYSAIKRVLLMVDGAATFGEISKRAAPSMRDSLDEMFQELEKGGLIHDKAKVVNIPKMSVPPKMSFTPKMSIPKMTVPYKVTVPPKTAPPINKPAEQAGGELDFMDEFFASTPAQLVAEAANAEKLKAGDEAKSKNEINGAKLKAQQEAEAILLKAEQDAVRIREEAERTKQRAAAEISAREEQARRAKENAEAARVKAEQEAKAREQAEKLARQQASDRQTTQAAQSVPEIKPAPEIKLDPFFIFDPFQIPTAFPSAPQKKKVSVVEVEPEIKLDAFIFDAPKAATPPPSAEPHKDAAQRPGNTAKTAQPKETWQPVNQQVPPAAAVKPVESKPSQEQIKRAEEQRIAAQAQANKLADAQARTWAEAEQRAADTAKASAELAVQKAVPPTAKTSPAAQRVPIARASRKPFPWGKLAMFMLVLLAGALFIVPYVLPMRDYMPKVEQMLSAKLHQPVHIGQLAGRILPTPRLELGEIYIGEVKQFQAQQAQIYFSILGLLGETKPIDSIELQGVKVTGAGLRSVSAWLQQLAADNQYPVRRMVISQGALDADAIQFTGIDGELIFNQAGKFTQANLRVNGGKIALGINAAPESRLQVDIRMYTSALPLLPSWSFDELTAKGELSSNGLRINEFDGRMLGGMVQGDANIDWRSGWRAQGRLVAKTITMQNMSKGLSGDMDGSAHFQMQATSLSRLADAATLDGTFIVRKGVINGIDIVETARSRSKESVPGGRTHFDELSGVLTVAKDSYAIRQLKMNAGELIVSGTLDIARQQVSGRISADLTKWAGMGGVTMQAGGTTDNPSLRAAR